MHVPCQSITVLCSSAVAIALVQMCCASCSGDEEAERKIHSLNITELWAMSSSAYRKSPDKRNHYASNGVSPDRIRKVLKDGVCDCDCHRPVAYSKLKNICDAFWALDKEHQDKALWSAACCGDWSHSSAGSSSSSQHEDHKRRKRRPWFLAGTRVCRHAFYRLLGLRGVSAQR